MKRRDMLKLMMASTVGFAAWPTLARGTRTMETTHLPAELGFPERLGDDAFKHYYRFLANGFYRYPTPRQVEAITLAEDIYQLTQGWQKDMKTLEDRAKTTRDLARHYARMRQEFFTIRLEWDGQTFSEALPAEPFVLTRCIAAPLIVEVVNEADIPLDVHLGLSESVAPSTGAVSVAPGAMMPVLLDLDGQTTGCLDLSLTGTVGPDTHAVSLPIEVCESATIRGRLYEKNRDGEWPGRVYVLGPDNVLRHGKAFANNSTLSEKPVIFRPASYRLPFFYSDGTFEIDVPAGCVTVTLERGCEHEIVSEDVTLGPGETRDIELTSGRLVDMKAQGWISGDTHIHWTENPWNVNEDIALLALVQRAEDLRVANNLTLYQYLPDGKTFIKPDQFPMGPVPGYCDDEFHIQMGEEYRNDRFYGHVNLLNIKEIIEPIATGPGSGGPPDAIDYPLNHTALKACLAQGGIVCEAHGLGPHEHGNVPINLINGLSEVLDQLDPKYYYQLLNCGFRAPLGNGSDHPARVAGCARVYVKVDGPFRYDAWIQGLRDDRSFVTSGPLLFMTVNGEDIGSKLNVAPGDDIEVKARVVSRYPVGNFQIVSNGEVIESMHTEDRTAELRVRLEAGQSRWFTARCAPGDEYAIIKTAEDRYTARPNVAHTSATYVDVDGEPVRKPEALDFFIQRMKYHAEDIRKNGNFAHDLQRDEAVRYVMAGVEKFEALRAMAQTA